MEAEAHRATREHRKTVGPVLPSHAHERRLAASGMQFSREKGNERSFVVLSYFDGPSACRISTRSSPSGALVFMFTNMNRPVKVTGLVVITPPSGPASSEAKPSRRNGGPTAASDAFARALTLHRKK